MILTGVGTPNIGYEPAEQGDLLTITLNSEATTCTHYIHVENASVSYDITCGATQIEGSYMIGRTLETTNKMILEVNVLSTGYWSISTNTTNGYSFRGSGTFNTAGAHTIELLGTGTPIASGTNYFNFTTNSDVGTRVDCTGIEVTVLPISYTVDCAQAAVAGDYKQDEAMTASNTVTLKVNVLATGETAIKTNTVAGIYFTSGPLSFDSLGQRDVVFMAVGTPTAAGDHTFILETVTGMTATCQFVVSITAQPLAFNLTCGSITVEGAYAPNVPMNGTNVMKVSVNVQYQVPIQFLRIQ